MIKAFPVGWWLSDGAIYEIHGEKFLAIGDDSRDDLPVEFFSHQLLGLDCTNTDMVIEFVSEYGIPRWPYRPGWHQERSSELEHALELSKKYDSVIIPAQDGDGLDMEDEEKAAYCSFDEVLITLETLQKSVLQMFDCILGKRSDWPLREVVNEGASSNFAVGTCAEYNVLNNLTNAICNQIIQTIASDLPWNICECEGCERPFKRFQPGPSRRPKTNRNPCLSRAKYCCKTCQDRQSQRNYRATRKLMKG